MRERLTYANVMSTLAVFVALGGSSYAALTINGSQISKRSIAGSKLKRNTLGAAQIRESRLGIVPMARNTLQLDGFTAAELKVRCPADTFPEAGTCIEREPRPAAPYGSAVLTCGLVGTPEAPGRRLPTHGELRNTLAAVELAPGGELTSDVLASASEPGRLEVLYVTDKVGAVAVTPDTTAGAKAYRCVADPLN